MRSVITCMKLLFVVLLASSSVKAQVKAIAYGPHLIGSSTTPTSSNFYKDYVGLRLEVVAPAPVVGDKQYTVANDGGGGTGVWGSAVTTSLVNKDVVMPQSGDSLAGSPITTSMTGKIALVYRGGGIEFVCKALAAQNAGAIACVIVNNIAGGPIGMGAGSVCSAPSIFIPVFMISKADGDALDAQYCSGASVKMTITNWGQNLTHDLGFIPGGLSTWHAFAVPYDQLQTGTPVAYKAVDGAFVANFGNSAMPGVTLSSSLTFTPNGGSTSAPLHTSSVALIPSFTVADSIYAMFDTSKTSNNIYDLGAITGAGRFDQTFTVSSTTADDYAGDNTATVSFYASDSVYSKGRYDFVNKAPYSNLFERFGSGIEFLWGPTFYVNKGGASVSKVQYSLLKSSAGILDAGQNNVYLFKWVDGARGQKNDTIVQNGELELVGLSVKTYDVSVGSADTSGAVLSVTGMKTDTVNDVVGIPVLLESNTWYYLAVDVPAGYYLGCDGINNPLPRIYGRNYNRNAYREYNSLEFNLNGTSGTKADIYDDPAANSAMEPSSQTAYINSVDSFIYSQAKGIIPSVAMTVNPNPGAIIDHTGVGSVSRPVIGVIVSPNPAKDYINVALELDRTSPTVSYEIIDGLARFVSKDVHTNVKSENVSISTASLAAGNYYLIINAGGTAVFRKFTVVK